MGRKDFLLVRCGTTIVAMDCTRIESARRAEGSSSDDADLVSPAVAHLLSNRKYIGWWPWGENKNVRDPMTHKIRQEKRPAAETEQWLRHFPDLQIIDDETFAPSPKAPGAECRSASESVVMTMVNYTDLARVSCCASTSLAGRVNRMRVLRTTI